MSAPITRRQFVQFVGLGVLATVAPTGFENPRRRVVRLRPGETLEDFCPDGPVLVLLSPESKLVYPAPGDILVASAAQPAETVAVPDIAIGRARLRRDGSVVVECLPEPLRGANRTRQTFIRARSVPEAGATLSSFPRLRNYFALNQPFCDRDLIHLRVNGIPPLLYRAGNVGCIRHQLIEFTGNPRYCHLFQSLEWNRDGEVQWAWLKG